MADITPEAIASLAAKIDGLDLSDDESSVLQALMDRAADADDVEGFYMKYKLDRSGILSSDHDFGVGSSTFVNISRGVGFSAPPPEE